ncbi:hypothetical protein COCC4DRAFT_55783 [Bipolaris maydis ATCC 48331]|uniref:DNA (cytosine-5-)-methyltransferase n=2 Tax=Cochliobolus heterostrophus TaxID=5016 RepID=M2URQ0_COCH5|nr:uncharacterized protein COCC4DRAFT_55783 [Bipolaris maydis ATCC 48331]EMD96261.1 hypothetical protein COCHEDRAFT_1152328 [Bipolaris maydis C5]KAJ5030924.1 S-adenosyl-L-methionine-dependent methyltransferase [Bipolaris maydis]ENI11120.1 hypothetical protein COCC4DRAFT_55783 [Bipolaris maydis ATCC 48331]KAJ5065947.1 C-5 cytosine methyltransferase DmtA [Bipolaris maydis]KAJ6201143.1 C-5 cytosine methyltransferase DmtA [Bipolaris maydis]
MSATHPYILDDDDDRPTINEESDFDLIDYDSNDEEPEVISHRQCASSTASAPDLLRAPSLQHSEVVIESYRLGKGLVIRPESTVELHDHLTHEINTRHSGDFLRVKFIVMNLETDEVRLRGQRMRRVKYLGQLFDWKLNELAMVLRIKEQDDRAPLVAGLEDVNIDEVYRIRECTLTNKPYPFVSFRTCGKLSVPFGMSQEEIKFQIFHAGRLTCRVMNIQYINKHGKSYSGVVRYLYAKEADKFRDVEQLTQAGGSRKTAIPIGIEDSDDCVVVTKDCFTSRNKKRSRHADSSGSATRRSKPRFSSNRDQITYGDVYCGVGGGSQGALQAGYSVAWGLDKDDRAIEAYRLNHRGAYAFKMDAHNFPPPGISQKAWRVDVLHLSPPCCYWSPAHTQPGPNDQANYESLYTVGPILKKVKPRVATLEQTSGLLTNREHKRNFFTLLNDIGQAGYDLRYKIQDLSEFGLVQQRKRLLIIAARRGMPLPPFPKPTHGPPGSGFKDLITIADALLPLRRPGYEARTDTYNQPRFFASAKTPYSVNSYLKGCITTGGTTAYHPSGTRPFTARELSLLQSFPRTYQFTGSKSEATKQVGNAFPPIMAQALYRSIAKTLKAYDQGLIGAENVEELSEHGEEIINLLSDDDDDEEIEILSD